MTVSDSQVLKVVAEEGFQRIGVKLTVSGSVAALEAALQDLTTYVPLLLVESVEVYPDVRSRKRGAPPTTAVFGRPRSSRFRLDGPNGVSRCSCRKRFMGLLL